MSLFIALGYEIPFAEAIIAVMMLGVYITTRGRRSSRLTWKRTLQYTAILVVAVGLGLLTALTRATVGSDTNGAAIAASMTGIAGSIVLIVVYFRVYWRELGDPIE